MKKQREHQRKRHERAKGEHKDVLVRKKSGGVGVDENADEKSFKKNVHLLN